MCDIVGETQALSWPDSSIAERVRAVVTHVDQKRPASYQYGDPMELLVKRRNFFSPGQEVKSLAALRKIAGHADDGEEAAPVAAE